LHAAAADERTPVALVLTPGQRGDAPVFPALLAEVPAACPVEEVVLDRAFDSDAIRELLVGRDIAPCIPSTANRAEPIWYDAVRYKERNKIERLFNRLKQFRRVATRYDKLAKTFLAFVQIAAVFQMIR
jgi:transposase